jgi:hypothetical protein
MMKAMKAKKAMKKTAKSYKSKQGAKAAVYAGRIMKSKGGLKKDALTKNKNGRIVSKKLSAKGKKSKWMAAVAKARAALKIKGFQTIGGKTAAGKAFLAKARSFHKK